MRKLRNWILVVAVLAVVATWVGSARLAAEDKDKPTKKAARKEKLIAEEGAVEIVLLRHKAVQEDLKLSDDVAKKVKDFSGTQWAKAQKVHEVEDQEKRETQWKEMSKENQKFLQDTLSADQRKRLEQIGMQVAGLLWLSRPDIAKQLNLTADQKKKAHELQATAHKEMHDVIHSGNEKEDKVEKIRALHKANAKRITGLLTDEQKTEWKKLRGEKFKGDLSKD